MPFGNLILEMKEYGLEIINKPAYYKQGYLEVYFLVNRFAPLETLKHSEKWAESLLNEV